jgi:glycosyltransferase involved in cell wall biosynthesis
MLDQITPVILTYNEAPNIARTLQRLCWASDIVVVDGLSDDDTVGIAKSFSQVRVYEHAFESFAAQWTFGLSQTGIKSEWVLGIDADFLLTDELIAELTALQPAGETHAYKAPIKYCIGGKELRFSLLPPLPMLYRRNCTTFSADAHTYRVNVPGQIGMLRAPVLHDDRKSLGHWLQAQQGYAKSEATKLIVTPSSDLNLPDRIRRLRLVAPPAVLFYCLLKGGILDGYAGWYYALQRAMAELMLSLYLLEHDLRMTTIESINSTAIKSSRVTDQSVDAA